MEYPYKWVSEAYYDFLEFIGKVYLDKEGRYMAVGQGLEMPIPREWGERLKLYEQSEMSAN